MRLFLLSKNRNAHSNILICEDFLVFDVLQKILDDVDLFLNSSVTCRDAVEELDAEIFNARNVAIRLDIF